MKTKFIPLFAILLFVVVSCGKNSTNNEFDKSFDAWKRFKTESQNSYKYAVTTGSFTGYGTETIIYVQNGKVLKRSFKATMQGPGSPPTSVVQEQWTEEEGSLNTHQKGAATRTLDEVYTEAKNNWLKKRAKTTTYFETKNEGMISLAGYVDDGCQDDCFVGITISSIIKMQF
ncbi:hypothetical protein [Mucilaginibacter auburnensis]|uniref:Lipocalin-like protein n=1 Tax=Mucilaginibacter auburnensis TaxID=1457233 RepID=A0A2H9VLY7_9SPHI|nr:hypothetical protein [Mucilaginibacter auburnensis]PJJ79315.1 hypothetical protein CLV57_2447 [Mucilaginibacter auburnensis]